MFEKARMEISKARSITDPSLPGKVWNWIRSYATAAYLVLSILAWGLRSEETTHRIALATYFYGENYVTKTKLLGISEMW